MLRRQTVVNRHHANAGLIGQAPAKAVMAVEVANDPTATMEKNQAGKQFASLRPDTSVDPQEKLTIWGGHGNIAHLSNVFCRRL